MVFVTCTILSVCAVTGSEKSPPGGLTAPTMVTLSLSTRVTLTDHTAGSLVERSQTSFQDGQ